ncbi:MAG: hypothetical protein FWC28_04170 [Proteobacteria bacterium]|nr:hypothetical protein [Cystobacterineae bacterium]MCL2259232.1 hypothetical protein [Cystobacterineae bacterium]MCL2314433.1 hypothetical protein [Pseudomonadota bacterium]
MERGDWFDGPNKPGQLARELLWFPGMSILEVGAAPSSFGLAKLLGLKFFHLEMSAEQVEVGQGLAREMGVEAQGALWGEREGVLSQWPTMDALVFRNVCGISMDELKGLLGKLSCPGSLLLVWPIRLRRVSACWEEVWGRPLWTPNELVYQLRGLGFESMSLECQPFISRGQSSKEWLKRQAPGIKEEDLLSTAYALVGATFLAKEA